MNVKTVLGSIHCFWIGTGSVLRLYTDTDERCMVSTSRVFESDIIWYTYSTNYSAYFQHGFGRTMWQVLQITIKKARRSGVIVNLDNRVCLQRFIQKWLPKRVSAQVLSVQVTQSEKLRSFIHHLQIHNYCEKLSIAALLRFLYQSYSFWAHRYTSSPPPRFVEF